MKEVIIGEWPGPFGQAQTLSIEESEKRTKRIKIQEKTWKKILVIPFLLPLFENTLFVSYFSSSSSSSSSISSWSWAQGYIFYHILSNTIFSNRVDIFFLVSSSGGSNSTFLLSSLYFILPFSPFFFSLFLLFSLTLFKISVVP